MLELTLNAGGERAPVLRLKGPLSCEAGVIRVRFSGTSEQTRRRVLGGALEGIYQPRLIPVDLIAAFDAVVADASGARGNAGGQLIGIDDPNKLRPVAAP